MNKMINQNTPFIPSEIYALGFSHTEVELITSVTQNNPASNLPYHNSEHCIKVGLIAQEIASTEEPMLSKDMKRTLFLAGLFHDYNHSGNHKLEDLLNIEKAIEEVGENEALLHSVSDARIIYALIYATEQPIVLSEKDAFNKAGFSDSEFEENESLYVLLVHSIRDADYMQYFENGVLGFENRMNEYKEEIRNDTLTVSDTVNYLKTIPFYTQCAQKRAEKVFFQII